MGIQEAAGEEAPMERDGLDERTHTADHESQDQPGNPEAPSEEGFIPLEQLKRIADGEAPWPERPR